MEVKEREKLVKIKTRKMNEVGEIERELARERIRQGDWKENEKGKQ